MAETVSETDTRGEVRQVKRSSSAGRMRGGQQDEVMTPLALLFTTWELWGSGFTMGPQY